MISLTSEQSGHTATDRYSAAYSVANSLERFGKVIMVGSIFLGVSISLWAHFTYAFEFAPFVGYILVGASTLIGIMFGFLITALAQMMQAMLDTAVNTSPLLNLDQKAEVIGMD